MTAEALGLLSEALDEVRETYADDLQPSDLQRLIEAGEVLDSLKDAVEGGRAVSQLRPVPSDAGDEAASGGEGT